MGTVRETNVFVLLVSGCADKNNNNNNETSSESCRQTMSDVATLALRQKLKVINTMMFDV